MSSTLTNKLVFLLAAFPVGLSAQETIPVYNLLDNGGILRSKPETQSLNLINDKDERTFFCIDGFKTDTLIFDSILDPIVVTGCSFVCTNDAASDPKSFKLQASNDGQVWNSIALEMGIKFTNRYTAKTFSLSNTKSFTHYRMIILGINGGKNLQIAELQLLGYSASENKGLIQPNSGSLTGNFAGNSGQTIANLGEKEVKKIFKQNGTKSFSVQYECTESFRLKAYSLTSSSNSTPGNTLSSWFLLGSEDGEKWDLLDTRSNKNAFDISYNTQLYHPGETDKLYPWAELADSAQKKLIQYFWKPKGTGNYLLHAYHINPNLVNDGYNYWWMAHTLDVFVDAYNRTGDALYKTRMTQLYNGALNYGGGSLWNFFYDDMEWMGLACLRAYQATGESSWRLRSIQLWNWIKTGWTESFAGGGIQWNKDAHESKNACSNAPAILLAARLYKETKDKTCLDWAIKIFEWMDNYLIFEETGLVKDSYGNNNPNWALTYNQGTWIGSCLELYDITGEQKYMDKALKNCDFIVKDQTKFSPKGILYNQEGGGDGGLFKGIFMRYLSQLLLSGKLDTERQNLYGCYIIDNGKSLVDAATLKPELLFGYSWLKRPTAMTTTDTDGAYDSSIHLSGVMLLELLAELERKGCIEKGCFTPERIDHLQNKYRFYKLEVLSNNGGNDSELSKWQLYGNTSNNTTKCRTPVCPVTIYANAMGLVMCGDGSACEFEIFDAAGRVIKTGRTKGHTDFISLEKGVYFCRIQGGENSYKQNFMVR